MSFRLAHQLGVEQPRVHEMAELVSAIRGALRSGTDQGRTFALTLEDLHLCHSSDFVLVDELVALAESRPDILLVITSKMDKIPLRSREALFNTLRQIRSNAKSSVITLDPMTLEEVEEVLTERIPGRSHRRQFLEYIQDYCGGDFGSVNQLVDHLLSQDQKIISELCEGFTDFARIGIPGEVIDRYRPDLLAVPRESVMVLRSFAAWRLPARIDTICAISEQTDEFIDPIVDDLEERGFISLEPDEFFSLKPPLIADVLRAIMPGRKLRVLREKAFQIINESEQPSAQELHMWAEHAVSRRSVDPGRAHLRRALEMLVESGRYRLAVALLGVADQSSADDAAGASAEVSSASRLLIAWQQHGIGPDDLLEVLKKPGDPQEARIALNLLLDSAAVGEMGDVPAGLPGLLTDAKREVQSPVMAGLLTPQAVDASRPLSDVRTEVRLDSLAAMAAASLVMDSFDQAIEKLDHARRLADSDGEFRLVIELSIIQAIASFYYGDSKQSESLARHARDISSHFRYEQLASTADAVLALCSEGEPGQASECFRVDASPVSYVLGETIWAVGRSELLTSQDAERALQVFDPLRRSWLSKIHYPFLAWVVLQKASQIAFAMKDRPALIGIRDDLSHLMQEYPSPLLQAESISAMSRLARLDGQLTESTELLSRAIGIFRWVASRRSVTRCLIERGALWVDLGDLDAAADDFHSAYQLSAEQDDPRSRQDAKVALRSVGRQPRLKRRKRTEGLSPREREVALLATEGFTDQQISEQLGISRRTVTSHMTAILRKLGARSRFEISQTDLV